MTNMQTLQHPRDRFNYASTASSSAARCKTASRRVRHPRHQELINPGPPAVFLVLAGGSACHGPAGRARRSSASSVTRAHCADDTAKSTRPGSQLTAARKNEFEPRQRRTPGFFGAILRVTGRAVPSRGINPQTRGAPVRLVRVWAAGYLAAHLADLDGL